jgi:hypothetical protein
VPDLRDVPVVSIWGTRSARADTVCVRKSAFTAPQALQLQPISEQRNSPCPRECVRFPRYEGSPQYGSVANRAVPNPLSAD